ncbi:VanZ family protein [Flavobacteriaceae bacterium]|jgi:VanZ family protein|nr:VanZ family protein [Flavobacteriaceae bacterium]MDB4324921.1 VanZ family protein [Flavobacteriaceae bacterium]
MRQGIKSWLGPRPLLGIAITYTLLITAALLTPITGAPKIEIPFADKMVHLIINAGLFMVWASYVFSGKTNTKTKKTYTLPLLFVCTLLYGILIEVVQGSFIPTRGADFFDVVANLCGLILGFFAVKLTKKFIY